VLDPMVDSQVALSAFTGKVVIGVFQTLLAGNAGQWVPGSVVPDVVTRATSRETE